MKLVVIEPLFAAPAVTKFAAPTFPVKFAPALPVRVLVIVAPPVETRAAAVIPPEVFILPEVSVPMLVVMLERAEVVNGAPKGVQVPGVPAVTQTQPRLLEAVGAEFQQISPIVQVPVVGAALWRVSVRS